MAYLAFDVAYCVIPLLLMAMTRLRTGVVVWVGVVAVAVEWGVAFDEAEGGAGDYRGVTAFAVTGLLAIAIYGGTWSVGMLAGAAIRRLRRWPRRLRGVSS